ncbi:uncharacterized protein [Parasteatoda tepidariorum]|uniref:uncharacterized protein n=1 Tax=Parasteatoda tepidariorum TaxID=114398 RepID=UPI001C724E93|nr:uncharacterized protein LOC107442905 [Parasteatoda tepidariorum]XP_015912071.2 uncharacterized protein LOC107442905 [Parasteatoda tepidariorum]XP_015912072.2 uncharacterized protein LOC107442905 [Parasteatoda tepidariorum]XP_042910320.1 uncharacterized protein LOC107442905 [Parasteatoda tepidariorum]XP_042910321.1 uncharacterized protein LOC107442905 [Parasteatoda tepidariorum]
MAIKNFWDSLFPHPPPNVSFENGSIDVALKNCFGNYDTTACVRNSLLTSIGLMLGFFCILRITKLHILRHPQIHQFLVFYLASLEIICLIVKWMVLESWYQLELAASFLKMVQFIILCHFHWSLALRILHHQSLVNRVIMPLLTGFLCFYSCFTVLGLMTHFSTWDECLAPHWILLSFLEFLGIQLYVVAGINITKKINSVSAMDSFKWEQKRDLWSVILTYEVSSVVTVVYYSTLQGLGDLEIGCSGIFAHAQNIYSPVYAVVMVLIYLGPIWIMLFVFYPTRGGLSSEHQRLLLWGSCDGSSTSTFSPVPRFQDSYKQLILPVENVQNIGSYEYPVLRRSASSPAFFSKSPLTPIYEDTISPSRVSVPNYGTMATCSSQPENYNPPRTRCRHDSGMPTKDVKGTKIKVVSLNQCSGEMEAVPPSPAERI